MYYRGQQTNWKESSQCLYQTEYIIEYIKSIIQLTKCSDWGCSSVEYLSSMPEALVLITSITHMGSSCACLYLAYGRRRIRSSSSFLAIQWFRDYFRVYNICHLQNKQNLREKKNLFWFLVLVISVHSQLGSLLWGWRNSELHVCKQQGRKKTYIKMDSKDRVGGRKGRGEGRREKSKSRSWI